MTAKDSISYLTYLNNLTDKYNNAYHCAVSRKPIDADYSVLTEEMELNLKATRFKVGSRVRVTEYKNNFSKCYTQNLLKEWFLIDSVLKTNPLVYRIKYLNREKMIRNFYEK